MNQINSIPEATDRQPILLIVAVPVDTANPVPQVAVQGIVCTFLRRTPPNTVLANGIE